MCSFNLILLIAIIFLVKQNSAESKNSSFSTRIVGGKPAYPGQFPYFVLLDVKVSPYAPLAYRDCGGSLISSYFVLSAAQCIYRPALKWSSYYGNWIENKNSVGYVHGVHATFGFNDECGEGCFQRIYIPRQNIFKHSDFDYDLLHNDIALLRLSEELFVRFNQPIRLPPPFISSLEGERAVALGVAHRDDSYPDFLKYTGTKIISNEKCSNYYANIIDSKLCTQNYYSGSGTCDGDAGGPLVYEDESEEEYLVGITTGGDKICESNQPDVFTRVSYYLDWIERMTKMHFRLKLNNNQNSM